MGMSSNPGELVAESRRAAAVSQAAARARPPGNHAECKPVAEIFGADTFSTHVQRERLPRNIFESLQSTIRQGQRLSSEVANAVAHAMKQWAIERGATHFTHWFQPLTGLTAEKHDSFIIPDREGGVIERFSGEQLIQGEPDASSFPSGGRRSTFEARGYTGWDPSSPTFLMEVGEHRVLCIPSVFCTYHGEAMDMKTPLLRSLDALSRAAVRVLRMFGHDSVRRVHATVGSEQEYFLVDRAFVACRPDLLITGRTLIGANPPKGQELEDHYFGSIPDRVKSFMHDMEFALYRLGVPIKTRHNEVAPSQYETAPVFEEANVAADHNFLTMEVMRRVAARHDLALLLHEKPFAGINGSGKHANWSLSDDSGHNLLEPGESPQENLQFLVFLVATLQGVMRRAPVLRASVANAGNDHRLGANEAPPAIISVFLGETLTRILGDIEKGVASDAAPAKILNLGISRMPEIAAHSTDRNRTSPFAFTGNRFEYRAVGSSMPVSLPLAFLNGAVAEALESIAADIEAERETGKDLGAAVMAVLREAIRDTGAIRFDGNNYAEEWLSEAESRRLVHLRTTPQALAVLLDPEIQEFLERTGILTRNETVARYHTKMEQFLKALDIEVSVLTEMARTLVLPAAIRHQEQVARSLVKLQQASELVGPRTSLNGGEGLQEQAGALDAVKTGIDRLLAALDRLRETADRAAGIQDLQQRGETYALELRPAMEEVRAVCDQLEQIVADDLWPLPKYREMLFV